MNATFPLGGWKPERLAQLCNVLGEVLAFQGFQSRRDPRLFTLHWKVTPEGEWFGCDFDMLDDTMAFSLSHAIQGKCHAFLLQTALADPRRVLVLDFVEGAQ